MSVELPAVEELTVKVATPEASEVAGEVVIVSVPPRLEVNVTDLLATGFP